MTRTMNKLQRSMLPLLLLLHASECFQTHRNVAVTSGAISSPMYPHPSASAQSTNIFGNPKGRTTTVLVLSSLDGEELPKFSSDIVPKDDNSSKSSKSQSTTGTSSTGSSQGLLKTLNDFGQSLKPRAKMVELKADLASTMSQKIFLKAKACLYWTLYMAYRGYRGFFVILPAVFKEVYGKMEMAVDYRVLDDDDNDDTSSSSSTTTSLTTGPPDMNPSTGKVRWRTRITVSVLAGFVTLTYVVGGLARVLMKFGKTILSTSSLSKSFTMAAEEVEGNEERLKRLGSNGKKIDKGGINGTSDSSKNVGF